MEQFYYPYVLFLTCLLCSAGNGIQIFCCIWKFQPSRFFSLLANQNNRPRQYSRRTEQFPFICSFCMTLFPFQSPTFFALTRKRLHTLKETIFAVIQKHNRIVLSKSNFGRREGLPKIKFYRMNRGKVKECLDQKKKERKNLSWWLERRSWADKFVCSLFLVRSP